MKEAMKKILRMVQPHQSMTFIEVVNKSVLNEFDKRSASWNIVTLRVLTAVKNEALRMIVEKREYVVDNIMEKGEYAGS